MVLTEVIHWHNYIYSLYDITSVKYVTYLRPAKRENHVIYKYEYEYI